MEDRRQEQRGKSKNDVPRFPHPVPPQTGALQPHVKQAKRAERVACNRLLCGGVLYQNLSCDTLVLFGPFNEPSNKIGECLRMDNIFQIDNVYVGVSRKVDRYS